MEKCGWSKCDGKMISHRIQRKQQVLLQTPLAQVFGKVFGKVPEGKVFVFLLFYYVKHQSLSYFVFLVSLFPRNKPTSENSKAAGFLNRSRRIRKEINLDTKTFLLQMPNAKKVKSDLLNTARIVSLCIVRSPFCSFFLLLPR